MALSLSSSVTAISGAPVSAARAPSAASRTASAAPARCGPFDFLKKKDSKGGGKAAKGKAPKGKALSNADIAARNKAQGWVSSSGGGAGFASKSKAYIETKGKYVDDGYVDDDADFMGKIFGRGKK